ncbi:MAG: DUF3035 domain-containing protein [Alphaproteobacteria bacterium]
MSEIVRNTCRGPLPWVAACLALAVALPGCEEAREALGFSKQPPDEFQVVARAPLSVPPDFTLRPPEPGVPRPQEGTPEDQARDALLGSGVGAPTAAAGGALSPGEAAVLANAGAEHADPNIRDVLNEENAVFAARNKRFVDRIIFWRQKVPEGVVVDPEREAQRLEENAALGDPMTEGETPVIEEREKGWLEGFF